MELARRALRRRHPELDERELSLAFVALCYHEDLAKRVRAYLRERGL